MEQVRQVLRHAFSMHGDTASYDEIHDRIISGGEVKGTNLCILMLAIFIASIGLNMNSTAVIIGAMLISPLMGGIMAIGYGIATGDLLQARNSLVGLAFQVIVCLVTSTIYFTLSPITAASTELIARTSPTIWDVMIAFFGGFAGIIGMTRKEKSNVIPGVAIATALMPPLCTAGYGLAIHSLKFFGGALYLFIINSYFICLATIICLLILNVPSRRTVKIPPDKMKRLMRKITVSTVILILPSLFFAGRLVFQQMNEATAVHNGNNVQFEVARMTEELTIIYPEITKLQIGYLDEWDAKMNQPKEQLTVFIYSREELSDGEKEKISKWMNVETGYEQIEFMTDQ